METSTYYHFAVYTKQLSELCTLFRQVTILTAITDNAEVKNKFYEELTNY